MPAHPSFVFVDTTAHGTCDHCNGGWQPDTLVACWEEETQEPEEPGMWTRIRSLWSSPEPPPPSRKRAHLHCAWEREATLWEQLWAFLEKEPGAPGDTSEPAPSGELHRLWAETRDPLVEEALQARQQLEVPRTDAAGLVAFVRQLDLVEPDAHGARITAIGCMRAADAEIWIRSMSQGALDPRWTPAVRSWWLDGERPEHARSDRFWLWVLRGLDHQADPRTAALLEDVEAAQRLSPIQSQWRARRRSVSGATRRLTEEERGRLQAEVAAAQAEREAVVAAEQALQQAFVEAVDQGTDDAYRVLADRWTEVGDPRGEHVLLSLTDRDETQQTRWTALQKRWKELLGPLGAHAYKGGLVFERGLPERIVVRPSAAGIAEDPAWRSVRVLGVKGGWLLPRAAVHLHTLVHVDPFQIEGLLYGTPPDARIRTIELAGPLVLAPRASPDWRLPSLQTIRVVRPEDVALLEHLPCTIEVL